MIRIISVASLLIMVLLFFLLQTNSDGFHMAPSQNF